MAKARDVTGLDCGAPIEAGARLVLQVRWEEMRDLARATSAEPDDESIHDMRVSTRRLRSAFRDFRPFIQTKALRQPMRSVRDIADALGAVRDEDVAIKALEKNAADTEPGMRRDGIELLVAERRPIRNAAVEKLLRAIEGSLEGLDVEFSKGLERIQPRSPEMTDTFRTAGQKIITRSFAQLNGLSQGLYKPHRQRPLHRMRIGAKRLRYAMELFAGCWGDDLENAATAVAEMQTALGDLHDCDVWITSLGWRLRHFSKQREPETSEIERALNVAAIWLLGRFTRDRSKHFRAALNLWHGWTNTDFEGRLRDILSRD
jgi:CHAD domain-containing protein